MNCDRLKTELGSKGENSINGNAGKQMRKLLDNFTVYELVIISIMATIGIAVKPVIVPVAHLISGPLMIPSGAFAGGLYMLWLIVGMGIVGKHGTATLIRLDSGARGSLYRRDRFPWNYVAHHIHNAGHCRGSGSSVNRTQRMLRRLCDDCGRRRKCDGDGLHQRDIFQGSGSLSGIDFVHRFIIGGPGRLACLGTA